MMHPITLTTRLVSQFLWHVAVSDWLAVIFEVISINCKGKDHILTLSKKVTNSQEKSRYGESILKTDVWK